MTLQGQIAALADEYTWEHVLSAVSGVLKDQDLHEVAEHVDAARDEYASIVQDDEEGG